MERCQSAQCILLLAGLCMISGAAMAQDGPALRTVAHVDLDRYAGTWYELARLPNRFQKQCRGNVTADYRRLDDGTIEVVNRCQDNKGKLDEARGVARVVDAPSSAKLEVSFVSFFGWHLFWGDYWIIDLGADYEYAVIGEPGREYGWVLARSTSLPPDAWNHIRQFLQGAGYDPERFLQTRQEAPAAPH